MPTLETMAKIGMPLLIHGEVTNVEVDIFDREKKFIETTLDYICKKLPELKITLEHITTKDATIYINEGNKNLVASITPHHLALNRNALFVAGIRPHNYCLPILKREIHRLALCKAATSGNKKYFLGTDTAPHLKTDKETACGCAGVFNSTYALPILAHLFEKNCSLKNLEKFTSINGAKHYNLSINKKKLKLVKRKEPIKLLEDIYTNKGNIKIFQPPFKIYWKVII